MKNMIKNSGRSLLGLVLAGALGAGITSPIAYHFGREGGSRAARREVGQEVETAMEDLRSRGSCSHIDTAKKVEIKPIYGTNGWDSVNIKGIEISQKGVKVIRGSYSCDVAPTKVYEKGTTQFEILRPLLTVEVEN